MNSEPLAMPAVRPRWKRWLLDSAIARMVIFVAIAFAIGFLCSVAFKLLGWEHLPKGAGLRITAEMLLRIVPTLGAYLVLAHFVEKRRLSELRLAALVPHLSAGFLAGVALMASVMGVLWLAGSYHVIGVNAEAEWVRPLLVYGLATAVLEEIVFRGVMFRLISKAWNFWAALAVSALFFGGAHAFNPGATLWTDVAIAVEAGVLLAVVFHVTHSLWACIGLHMAWNFLEGAVIGSAVSGIPTKSSWLLPQFSGPDWLTGGDFGIEASVVTVAMCLAFSAALLAAARKSRTAQNEALAAGTA
jgi:membrane protease YdiL (CAAX protease family)